MKNLGMTGTKWELFTTSIDMFCKKGYGNVSIRAIAAKTGIKSAAIYYHFKNKDEILSLIYDFYAENYYASLPSLDEILELIDRKKPEEVFDELTFHFEKDLRKVMIKITQIAVKEKDRDKRADKLLKTIYYDITKEYWGAVLNKMIKKKIIEPFDVEAWTTVLSHFDFTTALRNDMTFDEWRNGRDLLYSLIRIN